MIDISPELLTIFIFVFIFLFVFTGYPIAFAMGAIGLFVGFLVFGESVLPIMYSRVFALLNNYSLAALPSFVFMGIMLQHSGITEKMFDVLYLWFRGMRGGLAVATILVGTIVAACVGVIAASVSMLALTALPAMIKRGYSKSFAAGAVAAGGCLGILIPPSLLLVLYGPMAGISVGKLFMAAFMPGLVLSGLYSVYILIRSIVQPKLAPAITANEQQKVPLIKMIGMLISSLLPPTFIVLSVLGVIFFGIAPPTEAAAVGALASVLLAIAYRRFTWEIFSSAVKRTLYITAMILLIGSLSYAFVGVFLKAGCGDVVKQFIVGMPGGRWAAFGAVMAVIFFLGFFIDMIGILFIIVPIVAPLGAALEFDPLWYGMMICINFQMSFMTPPFASAIFYIKGAADPKLGITTAEIIKGVIPYVLLIMVGLGLCVAFPQIIMWLPSMMIK